MTRLTCKEVAYALDVQPTKATQAMMPALAKVAACMLLYPDKTLAELANYSEQLRAQWERERPELLSVQRR